MPNPPVMACYDCKEYFEVGGVGEEDWAKAHFTHETGIAPENSVAMTGGDFRNARMMVKKKEAVPDLYDLHIKFPEEQRGRLKDAAKVARGLGLIEEPELRLLMALFIDYGMTALKDRWIKKMRNKKGWEWEVSCGKCGYKSGWHSRKIAVLISLWHTLSRHLHGFNTISARGPNWMI